MKTFQEIIAWQKAYQLTLAIYKITAYFPKNEEFGLKSQIRRASVSIISNIAEGFKRMGARDQYRFYKIAESSLEETKCQLLLARDLDYLNLDSYQVTINLAEETGRTLCGWIRSHRLSS